MTDRKKAKQARRDLITMSAIECFIEKGINQTGVRDIAAKAEISLGNLYNHFAGKNDLIAEIAVLESQGLEPLKSSLINTNDAAEAIKSFVQDYLGYVSQPENAHMTIELISESLRNPTIAVLFDKNRNDLVQALSSTIKQGITGGSMRPRTNRIENVELLLDCIEGLGLRSGLAGKPPAIKARKALLDMIMHTLLIDPS